VAHDEISILDGSTFLSATVAATSRRRPTNHTAFSSGIRASSPLVSA